MYEEINIHAAKTQFSRLVDRAEHGEEIVIARAGKPVVKLVRLQPQRQPRKLGIWKNQVVIHDDFDELPQDILDTFNGLNN